MAEGTRYETIAKPCYRKDESYEEKRICAKHACGNVTTAGWYQPPADRLNRRERPHLGVEMGNPGVDISFAITYLTQILVG